MSVLRLSDVTVHLRPPLGISAWLTGRIFGPPVVALSQVSLAVQAGERVALLGPNGSGKTTLLRVAQGLVLPTAGEVWAPARVSLGFGDGRSLHLRLTARENLRYFAVLSGVERVEGERWLEQADLLAVADRPARTLSTGMLARLGLARALLGEPELLLLDEPERGLDSAGRRWLAQVLTMRAASGRATLVATHEPSSEGLFDRALGLMDGRAVAHGPFAEVQRQVS